MKKYIILIVVLVFGMQLTFSQTKSEKKAEKKEKQEQDYAAMKTLIETEQFTFEGNWATTQSGRRINLIGNPNFLVLDKTTAKGDLPYFGVVQMTSYGGGGGIKFDGSIKDYKLNFNDKKRVATITYSINNNSENFTVTIRVFSLESASVVVFSSYRNSITYNGSITALDAEKED
ncbi:DUF4251 domain-containing protein [Formosa sp. PL04]|uniref:DUF4251 domain-containing protein n=1 Tax=Formosa sp. PL04 TaxID=3081755 RepID=UPI0029824DBB|nr:DUF4251 domain-containing protein [Formosa sp. PL04]MDW5289611.1 DUF4251 domain-containing protein [Formosa sp. PL04]